MNQFGIINIGFGNIVFANRIIAVISPESAPVKRIVQEAKQKSLAVDATCGRRTRAVIITDSGHIILSALQPETLAGRVNIKENTARAKESHTDDDFVLENDV